MNKRYVIVYPKGEFLRIDDKSGQPYASEDSPYIWSKLTEATEYSDMFPKENLKILEMDYILKECGNTPGEIEVYVDLTDFKYEIGVGNAPGPHYVYNTLEEIRKKQPCVSQCGVIKAKLVKIETVQESNMESLEEEDDAEHELSLSAKFGLMREALEKIKDFTHTEDCDCKCAPVYECCCYDKDQWEIAADVLERIKR